MGFDCPCEELDSPVECEPKGCWIGNWSGGMPRVGATHDGASTVREGSWCKAGTNTLDLY